MITIGDGAQVAKGKTELRVAKNLRDRKVLGTAFSEHR
jgi:hypothetical protein